LVRPRSYGEASKAAKWACAAAQAEPGGIPQQLASNEISSLFWLWRREFGGMKVLALNEAVDATNLRLAAA